MKDLATGEISTRFAVRVCVRAPHFGQALEGPGDAFLGAGDAFFGGDRFGAGGDRFGAGGDRCFRAGSFSGADDDFGFFDGFLEGRGGSNRASRTCAVTKVEIHFLCCVDISWTGRGTAAAATWTFHGRVAAPPRLPR